MAETGARAGAGIPGAGQAGPVAAQVEDVLADVFRRVGELRERVAGLCRRAAEEHRALTTCDLASLRPAVLRHLDGSDGSDGADPAPPLAGAGVIVAPGVLEDAVRWLEWWRTPRRGAEPEPLRVDLEPGSVTAYEYPAADWFDLPRRTGGPAVVGPYVDYAGTDEYILTFAVPVNGPDAPVGCPFADDAHAEDGAPSADSRFFGVAAADIRATDFERAVLPLLESAERPLLLVNASGRVVASNTPDTIIGALAPDTPAAHTVQLPPATGQSACAGLPWSLRGLP